MSLSRDVLQKHIQSMHTQKPHRRCPEIKLCVIMCSDKGVKYWTHDKREVQKGMKIQTPTEFSQCFRKKSCPCQSVKNLDWKECNFTKNQPWPGGPRKISDRVKRVIRRIVSERPGISTIVSLKNVMNTLKHRGLNMHLPQKTLRHSVFIQKRGWHLLPVQQKFVLVNRTTFFRRVYVFFVGSYAAFTGCVWMWEATKH